MPSLTKPAVVGAMFVAGMIASTISHTSLALSVDEQRALFLETERAIERGAYSTAEKNIDQLGDYSLVPYLQLNLILENIKKTKDEEISAFLYKYHGSWLAEKLRSRWLPILHSEKRYKEYIVQYEASKPTTVSRCRYGEALLKTNQAQRAYDLAPALWLYRKSRPDECDYLFSQWRKSDQFSEEYLWERFIIARKAGEKQFANYLRRQAKTDEIKKRIDLYLRILRNPSLVLDPSNISALEPNYGELIALGIRNLVTDDPDKAELGFIFFNQKSIFSEEQQTQLRELIQKTHTANDNHIAAMRLAVSAKTPATASHIDWQLRQALKDLDWQRAINWITRLEPEDAKKEKWQYWLARARNQLGQSSSEIYSQVARERSYYGFLSAMITEQPYNLNHNPISLDTELYEDLKQRPGIQRARELNAVKYYVNARKSWNHAISDLEGQQFTTAAGVALESEIYFEAIRAMAAAKYWDDLDIRFPLIHMDNFSQTSEDQSVEISWAYAISRQESSFAPDIKSRSNAIGIMQILPSTAREMARDLGTKYDRKQLTEPAYNIPLGSAYLSKGKTELNNNMVYATAGYNAGINGVRRWLDEGTDALPLDVWIETIPYKETRRYVKRVLTYSVIFADKLGSVSPMEEHSDQFFTGLQATP